MKRYITVTAILLPVILAACTTPIIGSSPDKKPPRLVDIAQPKSGEKAHESNAWNGKKVVRLGWDRPKAFGPVPENKQAIGNATCQAAKYEKAIGYHPKALDYSGNPVAGGGYFCGGKIQTKTTDK